MGHGTWDMGHGISPVSLQVTIMLVNGKTTNPMDRELIPLQKVIHTLVNGNKTNIMDRELLPLQMEA